MKVAIASGNFDPLHVGHIRYLREASKLGDIMIIILNTDEQVILKKGFVFMKMEERDAILMSLNLGSFTVLPSLDKDLSNNRTLEYLRNSYLREDEMILAKGADVKGRREADTCKKLGIQIVAGVGGTEKIQSSSSLINKVRGEKE